MKLKDITGLADEVVCISLKEREDKRKKFEKAWEDILNFRWFITDKMKEDVLKRFLRNFNGGNPNNLEKASIGRWGCYLSHYEVISSAQIRGVESILILEDDAYPDKNLMNLQVNEMPEDWDIVYLGCSSYDTISSHPNVNHTTDRTWSDSKALTNFSGWKRVKAWGTYAMLINKTAFDPFLREINDYTSLGHQYDHNINGIRADGIYYFYLWKKMSFYFNQNFVLHDDSFESDIPMV